MDTRTKIISAEQARALSGATIVSGHFDPITHHHAARLQSLKTTAPLLVMIATPPNPILPAAARANLVAALTCVDYVVEGTPLTAQLNLEAEDAQRLTNLIRHVEARQAAR